MTKLVVVAGTLAILAGCSVRTAPMQNTSDLTGLSFDEVTHHLSYGSSCQQWNIFSPGHPASIEEAVRVGNIDEVLYTENIVQSSGLWGKNCIIVTGTVSAGAARQPWMDNTVLKEQHEQNKARRKESKASHASTPVATGYQGGGASTVATAPATEEAATADN